MPLTVASRLASSSSTFGGGVEIQDCRGVPVLSLPTFPSFFFSVSEESFVIDVDEEEGIGSTMQGWGGPDMGGTDCSSKRSPISMWKSSPSGWSVGPWIWSEFESESGSGGGGADFRAKILSADMMKEISDEREDERMRSKVGEMKNERMRC